MTYRFLPENAALESEIIEAAPYLGTDAKFLSAFEMGDTAQMGHLLHLVIMANRVSAHTKGVIDYVHPAN